MNINVMAISYNLSSLNYKKEPYCQEKKFLENTKLFKKTFILSLCHTLTKSPPLHQKIYCEMILFFAFNVLKLKLFVCSCNESKKCRITITIKFNMLDFLVKRLSK